MEDYARACFMFAAPILIAAVAFSACNLAPQASCQQATNTPSIDYAETFRNPRLLRRRMMTKRRPGMQMTALFCADVFGHVEVAKDEAQQ